MSRNRTSLGAYNREVQQTRRTVPAGLRLAALGGGGAAAPTYLLLAIGAAQTLATYGSITIKGLDYNSGTVTAVPTTTPTWGSTYSAGIGYGRIIDPTTGAISSTTVWIVNAASVASLITDIAAPIPENAQLTVYRSVTLTVTAGGTTTVYIPGYC
jgi:hypothetical protein